MSVIYSFMDDCLYGADEVNQTFSKLTTEGVSLFNYTNSSNPLVALNSATAGFVTPGVEMYNEDACKVTYDATNNKFIIGVGSAFMVDGSTITIDSEYYDITDEVTKLRNSSSNDIWVCFYRNIQKNRIDISVDVDDTYFNSEYGVPLAKISANNSVADMRRLAKTKVAPCSANVIQYKKLTCGTLYYYDTGITRRRVVYTDVFPGATKVFLNGVVRDIQRIDTTTGNELVFQRACYPLVENDVMIAFNMTKEGLEVWATIGYNLTTITNWSLTIF